MASDPFHGYFPGIYEAHGTLSNPLDYRGFALKRNLPYTVRVMVVGPPKEMTDISFKSLRGASVRKSGVLSDEAKGGINPVR